MTELQTIKLVLGLGGLLVVLALTKHRGDPWPIVVVAAAFMLFAVGDLFL